jgi:ribonucleoside-diphosphate reductase alpha chain
MVLQRMLDNVIDVSNYPLPEQKREAQQKRRIGIGITGFADMLAMLGISYGSDGAVQHVEHIMEHVYTCAEEASIKVGEEKGSFPLYDKEQYRSLSGVRSDARRNSHVTSIAPTGTISLLAGNISSGIEPIFDLTLKRKVLQRDNTWQEVTVSDYAFRKACEMHLAGELHKAPNEGAATWDTVAKLSPEHHLNILVAAQRWVDSSISKTINLPESITFDEFQDVYLKAYDRGAKSCTTYRPNEITGSILSSDSMAASGAATEGAPAMSDNVVELTKPLQRPQHLHGTTYRLKPPGVEHALFITINDVEQAGQRRPFEIFINTKNLEFQAWTTALTLMVSAIFRRGGDVAFITQELGSVVDPHKGGYWQDKKFVPSIIAGIGTVIEQHLATLGTEVVKPLAKKVCPKCNGGMSSNEGCWHCDSCDYSACG